MSDCARCRELESIVQHLSERLELRQISDMWAPDVLAIECQRLRKRVEELETHKASIDPYPNGMERTE